MSERKKTCVYLVSSVGAVKIGMTKDLKNRLKEFYVASPLNVEAVFAMYFSDRGSAHSAERCVQRKFDREGKHLKGSWYLLTEGDIEEAMRIIQCHPGSTGDNATV